MGFPPAEKYFDLPAELIDYGDIFGGEIVAIGSHPICHTADAVTHHPEFSLGSILVTGAEQDHGGIEDRAALRHVVDLEAGPAGMSFDPKELSCCSKVICKSRFPLAVKGGTSSIIPVMGRLNAAKDGSRRLFFQRSKMQGNFVTPCN